MEDDEPQNIKYRVKVIFPGFGWLVLLAFIVVMMFESEARCNLGNKIECAKMELKPK